MRKRGGSTAEAARTPDAFPSSLHACACACDGRRPGPPGGRTRDPHRRTRRDPVVDRSREQLHHAGIAAANGLSRGRTRRSRTNIEDPFRGRGRGGTRRGSSGVGRRDRSTRCVPGPGGDTLQRHRRAKRAWPPSIVALDERPQPQRARTGRRRAEASDRRRPRRRSRAAARRLRSPRWCPTPRPTATPGFVSCRCTIAPTRLDHGVPGDRAAARLAERVQQRPGRRRRARAALMLIAFTAPRTGSSSSLATRPLDPARPTAGRPRRRPVPRPAAEDLAATREAVAS